MYVGIPFNPTVGGSNDDPNNNVGDIFYACYSEVIGIPCGIDTTTVHDSTGGEFGDPFMDRRAYYGDIGTYFADVTGDGKADAIAVNSPSGYDGSGRITVRPSSGFDFGVNESSTLEPYFGELGTYFADVDGDNRADAIVVNRDLITVRRSNGFGFNGNESWTTEPFYGELEIYFADVDGDHRADAIVVNRDLITVRRSNGNGFSGNESWTTEPFHSELGTYFADLDGDHKADAIVVNRDLITVRRSNGNGFSGNE